MRSNSTISYSTIVLSVIIAVAAAITIYILSAPDNVVNRSWSVQNTWRNGSSLLFDTLEHMGYNVALSHRPIRASSDTDYVHVVIRPSYFCDETAKYVLDWVYQGGNLVFIHSVPNYIYDLFGILTGTAPTIHQYGQGHVITARPNDFLNYVLMDSHLPGTNLHHLISSLTFNGIIFVEYYNLPRVGGNENFYNSLPLVIRIIFIFIVLASILAVWHFGKRFGNPIQYYEEYERDENEHVHALAKLYWKAKVHHQRRKNHDN